jgi:hypothetical protein
MRKHKKHWNRFLNWLFPNRRARLISEIMKRDQEMGLYDDVTFPVKKEVFDKITEPKFSQYRTTTKEEMD